MRHEDFCRAVGRKCDWKALQAIFDQTRDAAYHIIQRKTATYYAVAAGLMRVVEAILRDQNTVSSAGKEEEKLQHSAEVLKKTLAKPTAN